MSGLSIQTVGNGAPLVLLHGWAMHGGVFAPLVDRLAGVHTLHIVDLPGHGHSRGSAVSLTLAATVDAILMQVPAAPWCGWSLGGLFALQAALHHPAQIPALVMLCASARFVRAAHWRYGVSAEIFATFAAGLREDYHATLERFIALEAYGTSRARAAVRTLRAELLTRGQPSAETLARGLALLQTVDLSDDLPRLQVPSLWIAGRRDRLVDPRAVRDASMLAPGGNFVQIEHGGHAPFLTDTDQVSTAIRAFLSTVSSHTTDAAERRS